MKKLWVDDERQAPDDSWIVARTVNEACRLIASQHMTEISLDHDDGVDSFEAVAYVIGEKYFVEKGFPEFCSKMKIVCPRLYPKITIHSANPIGAKRMIDILKDYGIACEGY